MKNVVPQVLALEEDLLIADDVIIFYRSQNADLIECILDLFIREVGQLYFFHGVNLPVAFPYHLEDCRIRSFA